MKLLSSGDVCEITGISPSQLSAWCSRGGVFPFEGGGTQGVYRQFTIMQTLGLLVACRVWKAERGCNLVYVGQIVSAFAAMNESQLLQQFAKGSTHFVMVHFGRPLLRGKNYDWIDVRRAHQQVLQGIERIEARFRQTARGRKTGLAECATAKCD